MWNPEHRAAADRHGLRYPSDLTEAEWALVAPLIRPAKRGGRPRTVNVREVLNAIFYGLWTGCPWKALPKDLPPRSTVWDSLDLGTGTVWGPGMRWCGLILNGAGSLVQASQTAWKGVRHRSRFRCLAKL